jgi:hypothetical protein
VDGFRHRASNTGKLQAVVFIHATTNDEDVRVSGVENPIKALKAAGKSFEHKVYRDAPGGHQFNRLDTKFASCGPRRTGSWRNTSTRPTP